MNQDTSIIHGPPLHEPISEESLGILIYETALRNSHKIAFIDEITQEKLCYRDVLDITCRLAESLQSSGYKQNDVLGICSENSIYFFCPMIAALYLGIYTVPISHYYNGDELQHAVSITKPKIIFCSESTLVRITELKRRNKFIDRVIVMGIKQNVPEAETMEEFMNKKCEKNISVQRFLPIQVNTIEQVAFILFSSGTTGLPKGVMITHQNCLMRVVHMNDPRMHFNTLGSSDNLGYLPFYHASGLYTSLGSIMAGKVNIVLPKFEEILFLTSLQKYKITTAVLVPTLLVLLAKSPNVEKYDLSGLEEIVCGSAPISESLEKEVKSRLKVKSVRQVYGLTEATLVVISVPAGAQKQGSVGTVVPGMSCVVRDTANGKNLGPNQVGELCLKGGMVMKGYYNNPEATRDSFTHDGWLRTGDLGYYDKEGYFYIVDRLKELIKYKSFQVPPAEIEALLLKHPKIREAAVIGLPDERAGELPLAFVVKQPNVELTENDVIQFVASHLSRQKQLHGGVRFIEDIPKNMSGKLLRRQLKEMVKPVKPKL